jgi:uncharacterized cupredoxin-like copper-binding protein
MKRLLVGLAVAAGVLAACGGEGSGTGGVRTVVLDVHHSAFSESTITVRRGEAVRFVIRNHDPIPHELIVGDQTVQDVHEAGTEAHHAPRPGEVSVAPGATAETTYTFTATTAASTPLLFGCHLPGHWAYGMKGTIRVI